MTTATDTTTSAHRTDPKRVGSSCRTDCSCGWRGPKVPTFGESFGRWAAHFEAARHTAAKA